MSYKRVPLRRAFTLIELLVVIAIIAILASILFPVFSRARENARRTSCASNMKQLSLGIMQYTQDYDERLPGTTDGNPGASQIGGWTWYKAFPASSNVVGFDPTQGSIYPYLKSAQVYVCPSDAVEQHGSIRYELLCGQRERQRRSPQGLSLSVVSEHLGFYASLRGGRPE